MLPDATDTRARPRIGRYAIVGRIGRGGMGMVYRGLDEDLEREVAIKTLTAEGSLDEDSRKRFRREGRASEVKAGYLSSYMQLALSACQTKSLRNSSATSTGSVMPAVRIRPLP